MWPQHAIDRRRGAAGLRLLASDASERLSSSLDSCLPAGHLPAPVFCPAAVDKPVLFVFRLGRNHLDVPPRAPVRRQPGVPVVLHPETGLTGEDEEPSQPAQAVTPASGEL